MVPELQTQLTWELLRGADSESHLRPAELETLRVDQAICVHRPPGDSRALKQWAPACGQKAEAAGVLAAEGTVGTPAPPSQQGEVEAGTFTRRGG